MNNMFGLALHFSTSVTISLISGKNGCASSSASW
jgi:hypothetical protein